MDACNELESTAGDNHARLRSSVGISKYKLHNKFAAIAMPFPV